jgi:hypothetical protein
MDLMLNSLWYILITKYVGRVYAEVKFRSRQPADTLKPGKGPSQLIASNNVAIGLQMGFGNWIASPAGRLFGLASQARQRYRDRGLSFAGRESR